MRIKSQNFLISRFVTMRMLIIPLALIALFSNARAQGARTGQNDYTQISEDGIMLLLREKRPLSTLIQLINSHSVAFQLTSVAEEELTTAGAYLGAKGVKT